ncbi:EipA family protein [Desulfogranum marinum]|uniref:EipA family protein n=1 Tax=Desulfogranum marinum TaxID=453220 RepID=UPI0029C901DD|nr:EipA family protein [Desulfogranum marinum]
MKFHFKHIGIILGFIFIFQLAVHTGEVLAEDTGIVAVSDGAVAVDVIVGIDKETRVVTLKNSADEEYKFTAGPEVKNFDQLKRGDLVIVSYYTGLAIALEPKGSELEERGSVISVERAKEGKKPGMKFMASTYVAAVVAKIDKKNKVVVLEESDHLLALKVGDQIDINRIEKGQEVEALYAAAYAIAVEPAPKVSGTVEIKSKSVAVGVGVTWGDGSLTMYDGSTHEISISGLSVIDVGITAIEATGDVYKLVEAKDIEGVFVAGEAGATLIGGGSVMALKNGNGVVLKLKSTQKGVRLTMAGQGLKIKLK